MFTRDSKILSHRLTTPLTAVANAVGDVFKPTYNQIIKYLFANGEQGFAYDPNDLSTMFQDAAGTVPVTGAGQAVGLMKDKSGRNNHAYQTNSASRPILRKNAETGANYLEFDGSDDFLQTSNIDFTSTDKLSLFAGVRKSSDATLGYLLNLGDYRTQQGVFHVRAPQSNADTNVALYVKGTTGAPAIAGSVPSGVNFVLSGSAALAPSSIKLRINAILAASANFNLGVGNFENYPLYIGRFNGTESPFNGHVYSLIGIGRLTTAIETAAIEKELAKRTGVTLNV